MKLKINYKNTTVGLIPKLKLNSSVRDMSNCVLCTHILAFCSKYNVLVLLSRKTNTGLLGDRNKYETKGPAIPPPITNWFWVAFLYET